MSLSRYRQVQLGQSPDDMQLIVSGDLPVVVGTDSGDPCDPNSVYYDPYTYDCGGGDPCDPNSPYYDPYTYDCSGSGQQGSVCDPSSAFYNPDDPSCNASYDPVCDELVALDPYGRSIEEYYNPPLVPRGSQLSQYAFLEPWWKIWYQSGGPNYLGEGPDGLLYPLKFAMNINSQRASAGLQAIKKACPFYTGIPSQDYQQIAGWDMIAISGDAATMGAAAVTKIVKRKGAAKKGAILRNSLRPAPGTVIPKGIKFIYRRKKWKNMAAKAALARKGQGKAKAMAARPSKFKNIRAKSSTYPRIKASGPSKLMTARR